MAYRFGPQLLASAYHFGVGGLGVRGDEVPSTGTHGAGYLYNDITLPGEAADEFYGYITVPPTGLTTFFAYEDSSFSASGPDGSYSFTYEGYKNGVSYGTATVTFTIGVVALVAADATHAHTADALVLTTSTTLVVADALHAHTADNITLGASGATALTIADALHAHTADALTLSTAAALTVADALHAHTADNQTLTVGGTSLAAADAVHAHTADAIAFTLDTWLTVADARHIHRADNIVLTLPSTGAMYGGPARTGRGYVRATLRGQAREPIRGYRPS